MSIRRGCVLNVVTLSLSNPIRKEVVLMELDSIKYALSVVSSITPEQAPAILVLVFISFVVVMFATTNAFRRHS